MREFEYGLIWIRTPSDQVHAGRKKRYSSRFVFGPEEGATVVRIQQLEVNTLYTLAMRLRWPDLRYVRPLSLLPQRKRATP